MKNIVIWMVVLVCGVLQGQKLDTIYANEKKNVALFFPGAIVQGITGASHFVFSYNREKEQYFGLLQAWPGEESNLLVVTDGGAVYSYILKYADSLPELNYFIKKGSQIGSAIPVIASIETRGKKVSGVSSQINEFKQFGEYLLKSKPRNIKRKRKAGISLQLERIAYFKSETYLVIQVSNASGITFDIDFLNVYKVSGNKGRNASYQRILLKPLYKLQMPRSIGNAKCYRFVLVFEKFVLVDNQRLEVELREANGGRGVVLVE